MKWNSVSSREFERAADRRRRAGGLTIIELIVMVGVIGMLAALSLQVYASALHRARTTSAVADIRSVEERIFDLRRDNGLWPGSLQDLERGDILDPWGNSYRYVNLGTSDAGAARTDRFSVPINRFFDLYSLGPDGETRISLNDAVSRDDIVRAADGAFVGTVAEF